MRYILINSKDPVLKEQEITAQAVTDLILKDSRNNLDELTSKLYDLKKFGWVSVGSMVINWRKN